MSPLDREDSLLLLGIPPDKEEGDTAERKSTEDNVLSVEVADDSLGEGEEEEGDAEVVVHAHDDAHKIDDEGCPVLHVMEHAQSVARGEDLTAVVTILALSPFRALGLGSLATSEELPAVEEVEDEEDGSPDGVDDAEWHKDGVACSLEDADRFLICITDNVSHLILFFSALPSSQEFQYLK